MPGKLQSFAVKVALATLAVIAVNWVARPLIETVLQVRDLRESRRLRGGGMKVLR